jgi:hypothetical protein
MEEHHDVHSGEGTGGLPDSVANWLSDPGSEVEVNAQPPRTCASCGEGDAIQWLRLVTDWEDDLCQLQNVMTQDGVSLVPLCNRCRAWVEIIEIAEMALPHLSESQSNRIRQERNRFLETLNAHLVRGIRVSENLDSFCSGPSG